MPKKGIDPRSSEGAGLRALAAFLMQESTRVGRRWRNQTTRRYAVSLYQLGTALQNMANGGPEISIQVLLQEELIDFELTDKAYAEIE